MKRDKICFEFVTVTKLIKRYIDNSNGFKSAEKYTGNNIWLLGYMYHNMHHDIFQKDLEETFSVRRSTVSKAINLLVQKGFIKKEPVEYDARLKKLVLTEKALQISEIVTQQVEEAEKKFSSCLTDEEIDQLSGILLKIRSNFQNESESSG